VIPLARSTKKQTRLKDYGDPYPTLGVFGATGPDGFDTSNPLAFLAAIYYRP
jgi:hypothetical protein